MEKDSPIDCSPKKAPGHQGVSNTGGIDKDLRVLYCSNVDLSLDYQEMFMVMKQYGTVERIKLTLQHNSYDCYVTFSSSNSAKVACSSLNGHSINNSILKTKLFNISKLSDDPYDFIPKDLEMSVEIKTRDSPTLMWHVAT